MLKAFCRNRTRDGKSQFETSINFTLVPKKAIIFREAQSIQQVINFPTMHKIYWRRKEPQRRTRSYFQHT
jgi:hypothetical protein